MKDKFHAPVKCPVCGDRLTITQLTCPHCETRLEGRFPLSPLGRLDEEQQRFVEIFLMHRGNLREAGKVLNLSYPTMRVRLDEILNTMGLKPAASHSQAVLEQLQKGEVSLEEAMGILHPGDREP